MNVRLLIVGLLCILTALVPETSALINFSGEQVKSPPDHDSALIQGAVALLGIYLMALAALIRQSESDGRPVYFDNAPPFAKWCIIALLLLATLVRLYQLDQELWFDEMLLHDRYMKLTPLEIFTTYDDSSNHILYSILARISVLVMGDTAEAIRLPSIAFGVASILAIYGFSRRVMPWSDALLTAALLAVSYHHVWFSQNARGYTTLLFLSLLSSSFLLDAIRSGSVGRWIAYAVTGALAAFTHLTVVFLFFGHFLYFLSAALRPRGRQSRIWTGIFGGFGVLTLLTIVLYAPVLPDIMSGAVVASGLREKSEWANPVWAMREIIASMRIGLSGIPFVLGSGLLVVIGSIRLLRSEAAPVIFFFVPVGIELVLMTAIGYTIFPRMFFFSFGFALAIVISGASIVGAKLAQKLLPPRVPAIWASAAIPILLIVASTFSLPRAFLPKQRFLEAIAYIESNRRLDDKVSVVGISNIPFNKYYNKGWSQVTTVKELEKILAGGDRVWVVYTLPTQARAAHPDLLSLLEKDFIQVKTFWGTLGGGEVVVTVSRPNG